MVQKHIRFSFHLLCLNYENKKSRLGKKNEIVQVAKAQKMWGFQCQEISRIGASKNSYHPRSALKESANLQNAGAVLQAKHARKTCILVLASVFLLPNPMLLPKL
ncbi:Uncharacterized protein Fot_26829 [Forsythia ovata]|uniref:Uncharacterized protein n=1 Tax=Forsythia ovata TaxID=205694 RepID=A0ABD1UD46_9LAMI